jgi:hypothetical protein
MVGASGITGHDSTQFADVPVQVDWLEVVE